MADFAWIRDLLKPVITVADAIAGRLATWIGRRKPRLDVVFNRQVCVWSVGGILQKQGAPLETMQVIFRADFSHDGEKTLLIKQAYLKGTQEQFGTITKFAIPPQKIVNAQMAMTLRPVIGTRGKPVTTRIILRDEIGRKYKTSPIVLRWGGPD
jgi:hypothetical protein